MSPLRLPPGAGKVRRAGPVTTIAMVNILCIDDDKLLATPGTVRKLLDSACGTGGMLAEAQNYLREHHSAARLYVYGQDYNKRAFAYQKETAWPG